MHDPNLLKTPNLKIPQNLEVVNSLNILFDDGVSVRTSMGSTKNVKAAVVSIQGDWKFQKAGIQHIVQQ